MKYKMTLKPLVVSTLLAMNGFATASDSIAYYSDNTGDRVVAIDPVTMEIRAVVPTKGEAPYPIGKATDKDTMISTRNSQSISVINNFDVITDKINKKSMTKIKLEHSPRSFAYGQARGVALVAGNDKPWMSLVMPTNKKNKKVIRVFKEGTGPFNVDGSSDENVGGNTSSGHPLCVQDDMFVFLNRTARSISLYNMDQEGDEPLDVLELSQLGGTDVDIDVGNTLSSAHHVVRSPKEREKIYFASIEGSVNAGSPLSKAGIMKLEVVGETLQVVDFEPTGDAAHHMDITHDGEWVMAGATTGGVGSLHIMSAGADASAPMTTERVMTAGPGAGHTTFSEKRNLAIVTNHSASYVTVFDMDFDDDGTIDHPSTWTSVNAYTPRGDDGLGDAGNIGRASSAASGQKKLSHTATVSDLDPQEQYYYTMASAEGVFFRIDLSDLSKYTDEFATFPAEDMLDVEATHGDSYLIQGDYNWNEPSGPMGGM